MSKTILSTLLFSIALCFAAVGQTNEELAAGKVDLAIDLMDQGAYEESLLLLDEAEKLAPDSYIYSYEKAFAHYLQEDYAKSIKLLKKAAKFEDATALVYQMMGNARDLSGNSSRALKTYAAGLRKFPGSGNLYFESGIVCMNREDYYTALELFEKGISADPYYPSNYFRAAQLYLGSDEKVWGMIYGETFMNLERNSDRTPVMSEWLYGAYNDGIGFENDSTCTVSFSRNIAMDRDSGPDSKSGFTTGMLYEMCIGAAAAGETGVGLASLDRIRTKFLDCCSGGEFTLLYDRPLFRFQKKVLDAGHFEAYNHWLLKDGDSAAFDRWHTGHEDEYDAFVDWMNENQLSLE